jgi:tetratricopeptide (TPR) repeat protein
MSFRSTLPALLTPILLASPLHAARKEAWVAMRSPHFQAYGDARPDDVRDVLRAFEEIRVLFKQVFPSIRVDPPRPMILLVTRDEASMKRFVPRMFEGSNPMRPSGLFLGTQDRAYAIVRMDAISQRDDQGMTSIFHEYTHSVLHLNFPNMPVWLDEGFADFYGATEFKGDNVLIGRVSEGRLAYLRRQSLLPLETLLTVTHDSPDYQEGSRAGIFYSESWALVHYLLNNESAQKAGLFLAYMKALEANPDSLAAARAAFGDLANFQKVFRTYAQQTRFRYWVFHRSAPLQASELSTTPLDPAAALLVRVEFLDAMELHQEAWDQLRSLETAPPPGPEYQVTLGMNLMGRNDPKGAERAFREAIRLGTQDFRAPAYLANLLGDRSAGGDSTGEARGLLERSIALRADIPWVHSALGMILARDPAQATQAVQEAQTAVSLDPIQMYYRANLGIIYMDLGQEEPARKMGETLTLQARDAYERTLASGYAKQLEGWLDARRAQARERAEATAPSGSPSVGKVSGGGQSNLKSNVRFSLPDRLAPLGKEILGLIIGGNLKEAQDKVQQALAKARTPAERKALEQLSSQIKAMGPTTK